MAEHHNSIYGDIVRLRFPNASPVFGAGAFAVVSNCPANAFVNLFETALEAQTAVRNKCSHAFCKMQHRFVNLAEPPAPVPFRKKTRWAKMIENEN